MRNYIEIIHLYKSYGSLTVLDDLHFSIQRGDFVSIIGESGSGKTTLLKLLAFMIKPQKGEIKIHQDKSETGNVQTETMTYICQESNLLDSLTNYQNIILPLEKTLDKKKLDDLAKSFDIEGILYKFPGQCSMGQKQRVSIVRALLQEPKIILADEITAHLDQKWALFTYNYLRKAVQEKKITVICVTHDEHLASFSDRILRIKNGKATIHPNCTSAMQIL